MDDPYPTPRRTIKFMKIHINMQIKFSHKIKSRKFINQIFNLKQVTDDRYAENDDNPCKKKIE